MAAKKKTFTITEAAKKLGISRQAVHAAIKKGLLRAELGEVMVPRKVHLISAESIKSYRPSERHQAAGSKKIVDA